MSSLSRGHPTNVGAHYQYLFLKELKLELNQYSKEIGELIRDKISSEQALYFLEKMPDIQKLMMKDLLDQIKQTDWGRRCLSKVKQKVLEKAKELYEFETQRNYFLVQAFRESTNPPTVSTKPDNFFNICPIYRCYINKELRRTIWVKRMVKEDNKFQFFKFDHQVCPYNLVEELSIGLLRLCTEKDIRIKENQKDCALRLLEYIVKKWNRIPTKSEQYLTLGIVELFAHYTPTKIQELGSIYVGLSNLTEFYFEPDLQIRMDLIHRACSLVDPQTHQYVKDNYLPFSEKQRGEGDLNQCFEHFRMTCTFAYFPFGGAQFIVDQLLVKKKNILDMYVIFAIMLMIMSDDIDKHKQDRLQLADIINPDNTSKTIKVEDVVDAFRVVYENVPIMHQPPQKQVGEQPAKNHLLQELQAYDRLQNNQDSQPQPDNKLIELKPADLSTFVKIGNKQPLRLGNKI